MRKKSWIWDQMNVAMRIQFGKEGVKAERIVSFERSGAFRSLMRAKDFWQVS